MDQALKKHIFSFFIVLFLVTNICLDDICILYMVEQRYHFAISLIGGIFLKLNVITRNMPLSKVTSEGRNKSVRNSCFLCVFQLVFVVSESDQAKKFNKNTTPSFVLHAQLIFFSLSTIHCLLNPLPLHV